ncbi:MAG: DegT/DnrJ/EryC1/StrS family aminotransferase [Bacteroidia bacterium]|nr:DegT/DnrJ/EryC1/StrS family aminotransferase [Bacteroidia bacterium]
MTAVASEVGAEVIEDAAHAFPAGWRGSVAQSAERVAPTSRTDHADTGETAESENATRSVLRATPPAHRSSPLSNPIHYVGNNTSKVSCFSFYANKTITTGEGGMAVTADAELAARMRLMSLHGMNRDAWKRFTADGSWDYHIVAPGFKYNMTDVAAALGLSQLAKAEQFRLERARIASFYDDAFADVEEVETLPQNSALLHAHHLYVIKLRLDLLRIDRAQFIEEMKQRGVLCSVHWRPLHMHPYYVESYGYKPEDFPVAASLWPRLLSLPIYPGLTDEEMAYVAESVVEMLRRARL